MKTPRTISLSLGLLALIAFLGQATRAAAAEKPPSIVTFQYPERGALELIFRGGDGPFRVQTRASADAASAWTDVTDAVVTQIDTGVYMALFPKGQTDLALYRVVSETDGSTELKGWAILTKVSTPANGTHFVPGESPVVTVTILDNFAQGLNKDSFGTLGLYLNGPQDPVKTVSAVKLLNATADRSKTPHHYINLKTNPNVQVNGNVLTYKLQPVTDEAPGTYIATVRATLSADPIQQIMKFSELQIGTATVETPTVTKNQCASCHQGPVSGKMYMAHIDPGYSPTGNWSLDFQPVTSCKSCHNNDGYAAVRDASGAYLSDHIIRRVHGIHMGEHLKLDFHTNQVKGDFRHYVHQEFPADVRNCTTCHVDDRWKTRPSRLGCASCHDNVWFGAKAAVPTGMVNHTGGAVSDDSRCIVCHDTDGLAEGVDVSHKVPPPRVNTIDIAMTPPANGKFYVAGEKPVMTFVFKDDAGTPIDHTKVTTANFSTANFLVYGPRSRPVPVLTSAAKNGASKSRASVSSSKAGPWPINGKIFKIAVNGSAAQNITITGVSNLVTAAEVVSSLNSVITNLNGGARASVSGANVNIRTLIQGEAGARFEIYNGDVTTAMGWKRAPNTTMEPDVTIPSQTYAQNDFRPVTDPLDFSDPKITRTAANITYQLDDVAGLAPGTYATYVHYVPVAGKVAGVTAMGAKGHKLFQIGTETPQKKTATNCTDCHGNTLMHTAGNFHGSPFDTDYCVACHDYGKLTTGEMFKNQGGTSLAGWSGYGAMPISRRVHGVHYAHYLEHSEEIYANATKDTFGNIIFPQDVRNCTKCHSETDTWRTKPSRVACMACHDSDEAKTHGKLMTFTPDPNDPYGPTAVETCAVCHGAGTEFSADKVHRIAKPFVPPYSRDPAE